jgi:hypothetical protein
MMVKIIHQQHENSYKYGQAKVTTIVSSALRHFIGSSLHLRARELKPGLGISPYFLMTHLRRNGSTSSYAEVISKNKYKLREEVKLSMLIIMH